MKKPKDVADLASRLASAASAPLIPPPEPVAAVPQAQPAETAMPAVKEPAPARAAKPRRKPQRTSVSVFLRLSQPLFERYDQEAMRRTRETGRGVTVQQVILDRLTETGA